MNVAIVMIKSGSRTYPPTITFPSSRPSLTASGITRLDFRKLCVARTGRREEGNPDMDKANKVNPDDNRENKRDDGDHSTVKAGDVMEHSFGEGYATRSDEEGFGGIYGGNDSWKLKKPGEIDEDHPDYDKSQGSEVKEKEKGRFQKNGST
ncbi:hypothetical protein MLD38_007264 [Melastoma candidum]|uniref:Uncharacterized protein n=1 Tax=Melastoma candidum TaxID=119954 RepID=A0ACB9RRW8_9MYRT|nr:hypothetical protein MLD38_007264 [Melastoma candidum]